MLFLSGLLLGVTVSIVVTVTPYPPGNFLVFVLCLVIFLALFVVAMHVLNHVDESYADCAVQLVFGFVRHQLLEFVGGISVGVISIYIFSFLAADSSQATPILATFSLVVLLVILVITDARYGWLRRMQSFTLAGSSVQFTSTTVAQPPRQADPLASVTRSAPEAGSSRVAWGLEPFKILGRMVEYDARNWAQTVGHDRGRGLPNLRAELLFAQEVVAPAAEILADLHEVEPQVGSEARALRFTRAMKSFAARMDSAHKQEPVGAEVHRLYLASWNEFEGQLNDLLKPAICDPLPSTSLNSRIGPGKMQAATSGPGDQAPYRAIGDSESQVSRSREECRQKIAKVRTGLNRIRQSGGPGEIFQGNLPYGASAMAWSLALDGELTGALRTVERWLEGAEARLEHHPDERFAVWRGTTNLAQLLFRSRLEDPDLGYAADIARRQVELGKQILDVRGWKNVVDDYEGAKKDLEANGSGHVCLALREKVHLRSFLRTHVEAANNFVNYSAVLSRKHGHDERLDWHDWERWVKEIDRAAPECFEDSSDRAEDRKDVLYSTAYLAYAVLAERSDSSEMKIMHLCKAKNAARKRRAILFRQPTHHNADRRKSMARSDMQKMQNRRFDRAESVRNFDATTKALEAVNGASRC